MIQAIATLRQRGLNVHLRIAGEDEYGGTDYHLVLSELICSLELSDIVTLLGAISEPQLRQELENAHVFALASLNEGVPLAVMEAMAMEIPVVVTDVGGMAELVDHNLNGILVKPQNVPVLIDAITQVLLDPDLAMRLSYASRQKIVVQFNHHRSAEAIAHCLTSSIRHSPVPNKAAI